MVFARVSVLFIVKLPTIFLGPIVVGVEIVTLPFVVPPSVASVSHPVIISLDNGKSIGAGSGCEVLQALLLPEPLWQKIVPVTVEFVTSCAWASPVPP